MKEFFILMIIFGICIFLYGLHIAISKNPYLPMTYQGKQTKSYFEYLGKTTMIIAATPIISGLVAYLTNSPLLAGISFIIAIIIGFIISIKVLKQEK